MAPMVEVWALQVRSMPEPSRPGGSGDVLAAWTTGAQLAGLSGARDRALVLRAEAGRLVARGDFDGAAEALAGLLELARALSGWGVPAAAEASAWLIEMALDAMAAPRSAPVVRAMSASGRARLHGALASLDGADPAGRLRAMVETTRTRIAALRGRSVGADGPSVVRAAAGRYTPGAGLATPEGLGVLIDEAGAFAHTLEEQWGGPMRAAVSLRLDERQREDGTGVLALLLGPAARACEADAVLRGRVARALEALR